MRRLIVSRMSSSQPIDIDFCVNAMTVNYRQDLDSTRAIAVFGVLLFHMKFDAFQGGSVGGDVFLWSVAS